MTTLYSAEAYKQKRRSDLPAQLGRLGLQSHLAQIVRLSAEGVL
jgi:hypothetical protein